MFVKVFKCHFCLFIRVSNPPGLDTSHQTSDFYLISFPCSVKHTHWCLIFSDGCCASSPDVVLHYQGSSLTFLRMSCFDWVIFSKRQHYMSLLGYWNWLLLQMHTLISQFPQFQSHQTALYLLNWGVLLFFSNANLPHSVSLYEAICCEINPLVCLLHV